MYTIETLQEIAPSVFATEPASKMSKRYTFVPTIDVVEKFNNAGWNIASASQLGDGKHAPHQVKLRNSELPNVGDSLVEVIIKNSHDGLATFSVSSGLHRLVCSNGLTVPTSVADFISVKHMKLDMGMVNQITDQFVERLPFIQNSVSKMISTDLTESQKVDMVQKAGLIRWKQGTMPAGIKIEDILQPLRSEDNGNNAWTVFNVIQEKWVRGGVKYTSSRKGRIVPMRELKNFTAIDKINTALWELAESYC